MRTGLVAFLLLASASLVVFAISWFPAGANAHAAALQDLYALTHILGVGVMVAVEAAIVWFAVRYRERGRVSKPVPPARVRARTFAAWIAVPAVILLVAAVPSFVVLERYNSIPEGTLHVRVTAMQWAWLFAPEGGDESLDRLPVPEDELVVLHVTSADVIHSLFVPDLALRVDAVPGRENRVAFTAPEPGEYEGACAEFCGLGHPRMPLVIEVVPAPPPS